MSSKFFINFQDNLTKLLVFYDVKTIRLKSHLEEKIANYKEEFASALETEDDIINIKIEEEGAIYALSRPQAELFYQIAKVLTYDNLIDFENKILLLFTYSEMEQYIFKSYKYLMLKKPEMLKDKTITIGKLLEKKIDFNALIEEKVEFILNGLFFEDFAKIFKFAEKPLGINHNISKEDCNELNEIRQIRNLFIHSDGIVNSIFLSKVHDCKKELGESYVINKNEIDIIVEKIRDILKKFDKALITSHSELI